MSEKRREKGWLPAVKFLFLATDDGVGQGEAGWKRKREREGRGCRQPTTTAFAFWTGAESAEDSIRC